MAIIESQPLTLHDRWPRRGDVVDSRYPGRRATREEKKKQIIQINDSLVKAWFEICLVESNTNIFTD